VFCLGTLRLSLTCILQSAVQPVLCQCATVNHLIIIISGAVYGDVSIDSLTKFALLTTY